ncbi:MAG TPA: hypothetical protein VK763_17215 [Terriglobales bacterium]|jgi:hypothetical protein|nr:hypothetical protein [Terriglobales bacterium]
MDSHQKQKAWRQLLGLTKDPEIAGMAKQMFGAATIPDKPTRERLGRVLEFFSLGFGLGGLLYNVINPEPNFIFGSFLLAATILFFMFALWESTRWRISGKVISAICAILIFVMSDYAWHQKIISGIAVALSKAKEEERKEAFQLLIGEISYDPGDNPLRSVFTYSNGSSLLIVLDNVVTTPRDLLLGPKDSTIDIQAISFIVPLQSKLLLPGGDGQSDPFLEKLLGASGPLGQLTNKRGDKYALDCADLFIDVNYHLDSQPLSQLSKRFRFVARTTKNGVRWRKEGINAPARFCRDFNSNN